MCICWKEKDILIDFEYGNFISKCSHNSFLTSYMLLNIALFFFSHWPLLRAYWPR